MSEAQTPQTYYYRGRLAETLTRDELLEAFQHAVDALERERQWSRTVAETGDALFDAARVIYGRRNPGFS
jgi:hypothetical protein